MLNQNLLYRLFPEETELCVGETDIIYTASPHPRFVFTPELFRRLSGSRVLDLDSVIMIDVTDTIHPEITVSRRSAAICRVAGTILVTVMASFRPRFQFQEVAPRLCTPNHTLQHPDSVGWNCLGLRTELPS